MNQPHSMEVVKRDLLAQQLTLRLRWLRYIEVALCVRRILEFNGYLHVTVMDRWALRGRTKSGGVDLVAIQESPLGVAAVIVQVRHRKQPVSRQDVDALRAICLKEQVPSAILVATRGIARSAYKAAAAYPGRPIQLIEGAKLGQLMLDAGLGVLERRDPLAGKVSTEFDESWFELLMAYCALHWPPSGRKAKS